MDNSYLDDFKGAYEDSFPYALDNRLMLNWYPQRILFHAKGDSLLELGIGHGYSSIRLSQHFKRHVIVEGSREIIEKFRRNSGVDLIETVHCYFEEYTTEEKFDVIVMGFVMEHVDDPYFILERFKHYLKPEGSIFISVPNSLALNKRIGFEAGMIDDFDALSKADLALGHKRLFTVDSVKALIESANCRVKRMEGIFLKPISTEQIHELGLSEDILQAMLRVGINYPELCVGILCEAEVRT
jgi:2-polyprenyl-3-methyl-5-hydroxy-6-metoxy-1,4-benzoquinol methylase